MGRACGDNDDLTLALDGVLARRGGRAHLAGDACRREETSLFTVYRLGSLEKTARYGDAHSLFELADRGRPDGRAGRLSGLFCAPSVAAALFWVDVVRANNGYFYEVEDLPFWQLDLAGPAPYVYSGEAWRQVVNACAAGADSGTATAAIKSYWQQGVPLDRFANGEHELCEYDGLEVIVDPGQIVAAAPAELELHS